MADVLEQDTCRICSAPAEPDQPLFHPCKCSGTIRYIHQDCLTTWLAHSKKKHCDVCKHPYAFTKVYAADMPATLPALLLARRMIQHLFFAFLFVLRGIMVAVIWLGVLPWVTAWTWRIYFSMGESTAWWISDRPRPATPEVVPFYSKLRIDHAPVPPKSPIGWFFSHPAWVALSSDIFTGQIIGSVILLTFVAIFLLREWIQQNARPGVFEEDPMPVDPPWVPPENVVEPQVQQEAPAPQPAPNANADPIAQADGQEFAFIPENIAERQRDTVRAVRALRELNPEVAMDPSRWNGGGGQSPGGSRRKRANADGGEHDDPMKMKRRRRRIRMAQNAGDRRRLFAGRTPPPQRPFSTASRPLSETQNFKFTFRNNMPQSLRDRPPPLKSTNLSISAFARRSQSSETEASSSRETEASSSRQAEASSSGDSGEGTSSPFPPVALVPPNPEIPYALRSHRRPENINAVAAQYPLRPPLPTSSPRPGSPFLYTPGRTPLDSPKLATYHAPEELNAEAGPSRIPNGYFGGFEEDGNDGDSRVHQDFNEVIEEEDLMDEDLQEEERPYPDLDVEMTDSAGEGFVSEEEEDTETEHNRYFALPEGEEAENEGRRDADVPRPPTSDSDDESEDGEGEGLEDPNDQDHDGDGLFREEDEEEDEEEEGDFIDGEEPEWPQLAIQVVPGPQNAADVAARAGGAGAGAPAQGRQDEDIDPAAVPDLDDLDGNVEDEMEGAMEAIGMRGPVYGVFQNAALMTLVLDTAIGFGIWIPFTIGKTTALLTLDPKRFLQVLHLPIRAMRLLTDPVVDFLVYIVVDLIIPRIVRLLFWVVRLCVFFIAVPVGKLLGKSATNSASEFYASIYNKSTELVNKQIAQIVGWSTSNSTATQEVVPTATPSFLWELPEYLGHSKPYFEFLGRHVRVVATKAQEIWMNLALGTGNINRVFAICLGYSVVALLVGLYLNLLTVGNARTAGAAVRSVVRQMMLITKVAAFIFIELIIFPGGCGIVLDLSTIWLFPEANLQSRMMFFTQAPLSATFFHWVFGTMFMYGVAILLSGCRSVMRPGAIWFIRDPQDQNTHPIRDILDRPTLTQLRKIGQSAIMYASIVALLVGSVAGLLLLGNGSITPFRWKTREPLSNLPVDLVMLHLLTPYTLHYFRPKRALHSVATVVWKYLAARLRLTSYFFGGRHPHEEYKCKGMIDNLFRRSSVVVNTQQPVDGTFRRVPATDHVALARDMPATVPVTAYGTPIDSKALQLMRAQDNEAAKAQRDVTKDYMIVYIPPHFRARIIAFICCMWGVGSVILGLATAMPLLIGRSFFRLLTPKDVHDGYSLLAGFYLLWSCYLVAKAIDRLDKRRQRRSSPSKAPRADLAVLVLKRGLLWAAKTVYMVFWAGIVAPILIGVVVDLYLVLPIRFLFDPALVPRMRIAEKWLLGLIYAKIVHRLHRERMPGGIARGVQRMVSLGWTRPDPVAATKEVLAPLIGGLLGMILLPGVLFKLVMYFLPNVHLDNRFVFMHVYPGVFVLAGSVRLAVVMGGWFKAWAQAIRDKEFLVEMRLRNHETENGNGNGNRNENERADGSFVDAEEGDHHDGDDDDDDEGVLEAEEVGQRRPRTAPEPAGGVVGRGVGDGTEELFVQPLEYYLGEQQERVYEQQQQHQHYEADEEYLEESFVEVLPPREAAAAAAERRLGGILVADRASSSSSASQQQQHYDGWRSQNDEDDEDEEL
ncbi:hypothetical protein D9613_006687 [Agrocybe pediades]|uniref:RING-type E3 ubiquitin transferase n=1 Tax=Agrocybe pediades TaxID=84607 RepID=A0A8H4QGF3_9AGAR|nr:hypothetical protein D9613_006687 [Agrocybe pediades]